MTEKSHLYDRMNQTDGIETEDLMTKEEREEFEKMTTEQQHKFMTEVIIPRAVGNQQ